MTTNSTLPALVRQEETPMMFIVGGFLVRYPERTRKLYKIHLGQWFDWCREHQLDPAAVHRAHIELWARELEEERGLKRASVATKLNAVCGMYKFAAADGFMATNPAAYVRRPKIDFVSTTEGLSRSEAADLLGAAERHSPMANALICLLVLNGLRIGEALGADVGQLGMARGYRTLHLPYRKGGKVATLALAVRTTWALDQYLAGRTTGPLFLGHDGGRLSEGATRRLLKRLCREIHITRRITPHSLRHTFVTAALDAGVSQRDLLDSTGHSTPSMIMYYDRHRGSIERNATHAVAAFIGAAS